MKVSFKQAVDLAKEISSERPNHIDNSGTFFRNTGSAGCLVGVMLQRLGFDSRLTWQQNVNTVPGLRVRSILDADARTWFFLDWLQNNNDRGLPWQDAFDYAMDMTELHYGRVRVIEPVKVAATPVAVEKETVPMKDSFSLWKKIVGSSKTEDKKDDQLTAA